jgi:Flp pilus assembly protein TadD
MEWRLGETDAARDSWGRLLTRLHRHRHGQSLAAQVELMNGSPARAAELYQQLVAKSPGFAELSNLGVAYFLLERYTEARDSFTRAHQLAPDNPMGLLNLGDATQLDQGLAEAEPYYTRISTLIDENTNEDWQQLTVAGQALAHLGESGRAVAAITRALERAPKNSQAAHEAALVYAVLEDNASAAFHAGRALELGCQERWFSFPWFDGLREDPRFQILTKPERSK